MIPLAEEFRPQLFEDFVGQDHLIGEKGFLRAIIASGRPLSLLFWGPPGSGKTTLAKLYAKAFSLHFITMSALFSGVSDIKKVIEEQEKLPLFSKATLLFVDEIHRFNRAQQDVFLPYVEKGSLILIGATTENPSFALNAALLSRLRVLELYPLKSDDLQKLILRYEIKKGPLALDDEAKQWIIDLAQGDGRYLFNLLENIERSHTDKILNKDDLATLLQKKAARFDKQGEEHYNLISALHKSVRGSDPDAALYWFARMLEGGEDPLFIARRLVRMALEDIGLADPEALKLAIAARDAYQMLGSPEGELALAEVVLYLALSPKSNSTYVAYNSAREKAKLTSHLSPPKTILNAPTTLMRSLGYGKNYAYDHETPDGFSGQNYFPDGMEREPFYCPVERGFEREMKKRITYFATLRKKLEN